MKMKTWWKIRRLSSFLFPSPLFLLFSDWFLPACPCSVFISFSCGLLYSLSVLALLFFGFCEFVLWRRRRSWGTLAFSLVFLPLFLFRLPFFLSSPLCIISLLWVFASVFALSFPVWFFFLLLLCSVLPFIEPESLKTSPVFAGLLFKSRTGSWAGDVVHDLLQISCWIGFLRAKRKGWWTVLPNGAVCVLGNGYFSLWSLNVLNSTIWILISNN